MKNTGENQKQSDRDISFAAKKAFELLSKAKGSGEFLKSAPKITVLLERHGETFRPRELPEDAEDFQRVGKLTPEGEAETIDVAKEKARDILEDGQPTTFFFLGSPSEYFIDGKAYGSRGQDTAQKSAKAVQEVIEEMGLSPQQADIHFFGRDDQGSRPNSSLKEPNYFYVDGSEDPAGYFSALQEKYGKDGREEAWLSIPEELEEIRKSVKAHSAAEVAARVMKLIRNLEVYASMYAQEHPDRQMVFLLASHGDVMRAVMQYGFGAGESSHGYTYGHNEIMEVHAQNFKATTEFGGKTYETEL